MPRVKSEQQPKHPLYGGALALESWREILSFSISTSRVSLMSFFHYMARFHHFSYLLQLALDSIEAIIGLIQPMIESFSLLLFFISPFHIC